MKTFTMLYPGDPSIEVVEMSRAEFLKHHPRSPCVIRDMSTGYEIAAVNLGENEIHCDGCDKDPGEFIYVIGGAQGSWGYCKECFEESFKPYCKE